MELLILRHGEAEDNARDDFSRRLTDVGLTKCRQAGRGLARLGLDITHVWSSPLPRAAETAEAVLPGWQPTEVEELANEPVERLLDALRRLPDSAVVLLVGHEPQLSTLVETLLGTRHGFVQMKKAQLAWVSVDLARWPQSPALLVCLLAPGQLRRLGE